MSKRIYKVTDTSFNVTRLVRATTPAQAVGHVARKRFDVKVASQDELVELLRDDDVTVETAGEEPASDAPIDQAGGEPSSDQAGGTPSGGQQEIAAAA